MLESSSGREHLTPQRLTKLRCTRQPTIAAHCWPIRGALRTANAGTREIRIRDAEGIFRVM